MRVPKQCLSDAPTLKRELRRKGFVPVWQEFIDGLAAIRSLDANDIDVALVIALNDVVVAKRETRKMVLVSELRSIAPSCCDKGELFADHMLKRYTLTSEYLADYHEDVLLVLHQETIKLLEQRPDRHPASVGFVNRETMQRAGSAIGARSDIAQIDESAEIADVGYWILKKP
jgi:hypothetical protein